MKYTLFAISIVVMLSACTARERVASIDTTFLEDVDIKSKKENLPFEHSWVASSPSKSDYEQIFIKPVRLDKLPEGQWRRSKSVVLSSKEEYDSAAEEIAQYFREELKKKIQEQSVQRYVVADTPGAKTLIIEIALTELEFSHPVARTASLAAPIPGTGPALSTITDPHVAFAARVTDAETGELLATAADRKFPPLRIIDLNKLTVKSSAREVCALWAESLAQALQGNGEDTVSEKKFSLLPW